MTAQRWWVQLAARWLARLDGVKGQIQMLSLAITAFSTFSIMLQGFGLGRWVPYLGVGGVLAGVVYTYLYTEGGVWNQVARDRQDMSGNWAGPNGLIQAKMTARTLAAADAARELTVDERAAVDAEADAVFTEHRDGVDLTPEEAAAGATPARGSQHGSD
jgi:hypothetical protein